MRASIVAFIIGCLAVTCQGNGAQSATRSQEVKKNSADKAANERREKAAASSPKGFNSICIGCGAK